jgi:hypothetical protein
VHDTYPQIVALPRLRRLVAVRAYQPLHLLQVANLLLKVGVHGGDLQADHVMQYCAVHHRCRQYMSCNTSLTTAQANLSLGCAFASGKHKPGMRTAAYLVQPVLLEAARLWMCRYQRAAAGCACRQAISSTAQHYNHHSSSTSRISSKYTPAVHLQPAVTDRPSSSTSCCFQAVSTLQQYSNGTIHTHIDHIGYVNQASGYSGGIRMLTVRSDRLTLQQYTMLFDNSDRV